MSALRHGKLLSLPKTVQIAEAVRTQLDSAGGLALERRRAGIRRGQALDDHHLVRLGVLEPDELDVVLLGHDVRYLDANVVPGYSHLGQMLGRVAVDIRFIDWLEVTLSRPI